MPRSCSPPSSSRNTSSAGSKSPHRAHRTRCVPKARELAAPAVVCLGLGGREGLAAKLSFGQQDSKSPALDEGADRSARLLANARQEGSLSLYASMAEKDLIRLVSEFERRYAIKVKVWRSGKNNVLRRAGTEARPGRLHEDGLHNPPPRKEPPHPQRQLPEVRSPYQRELLPQTVSPHREWAGPRV